MKKGLVLLVMALLLLSLVGCSNETTNSSPSNTSESSNGGNVSLSSSNDIESRDTKLDYEVLRQWKPDNVSSGLGLELLLETDLETVSQADLVDFIRTIAGNHNPVVVTIYSSNEAYNEEKTGKFTAEYGKGYILFYVKNTTNQGPYRGFNEIRWMQETGKFSGLFGTKTKL